MIIDLLGSVNDHGIPGTVTKIIVLRWQVQCQTRTADIVDVIYANIVT
jgi:hypothetical protein